MPRLLTSLLWALLTWISLLGNAPARVALPQHDASASASWMTGGDFGLLPNVLQDSPPPEWTPADGLLVGPNLYAYVRQNPWSKFDPHGLSGDRVDPDGFKWSDRDHHIVPAQVARDARWDKSAKEVCDNAKVTTPNGHNFRAHGHYNREVAAEMAEFLGEHAPNGVGGMSAKEQRALAEQFVQSIQSTESQFIKGFNEAVKDGPKGVDKWFNKAGKSIVMKSTGAAAAKGGKIVTGIAKGVGIGGKLMRGIPIVSGILVGGGALAQGKSANEAGIDVLMSSTGGDVAQWALENNPITKAGVRVIENHSSDIKNVLKGTPFEDEEE